MKSVAQHEMDVVRPWYAGFSPLVYYASSRRMQVGKKRVKENEHRHDHVPAWVCSKCGEQYFDAPVYKRLEQIARQRERITETVCFSTG